MADQVLGIFKEAAGRLWRHKYDTEATRRSMTAWNRANGEGEGRLNRIRNPLATIETIFQDCLDKTQALLESHGIEAKIIPVSQNLPLDTDAIVLESGIRLGEASIKISAALHELIPQAPPSGLANHNELVCINRDSKSQTDIYLQALRMPGKVLPEEREDIEIFLYQNIAQSVFQDPEIFSLHELDKVAHFTPENQPA